MCVSVCVFLFFKHIILFYFLVCVCIIMSVRLYYHVCVSVLSCLCVCILMSVCLYSYVCVSVFLCLCVCILMSVCRCAQGTATQCTATLLVAGPLDYEQDKLHNIVVRVVDEAGLAKTQPFTIMVRNVNDRPEVSDVMKSITEMSQCVKCLINTCQPWVAPSSKPSSPVFLPPSIYHVPQKHRIHKAIVKALLTRHGQITP